MNFIKLNIKRHIGILLGVMVSMFALISCDKELENVTYGSFSSSFPGSETEAKAAVSAMYAAMVGTNQWQGGWTCAAPSFRVQSNQTTDESVCYWGDGGLWANLNALNFTPDFSTVTGHYTNMMPIISEITMYIDKIQKINMSDDVKSRYVAELKALRAYYSQILYLYYGPVPIRTKPEEVNNSSAPVLPRPTKEEMVSQILKDYEDAISVLPDKFTGADYGRFSKAACLTARMKLYMQEKNWTAAITDGEAIKAMNFSLTPKYTDNFDYINKGGNSEIILAIVCVPTSSMYSNQWLPHALPTDFIDTTGLPLTKWGGYRMPWKTYDKFDQSDKRLLRLMQRYPIGISNGVVTWRDARAKGDLGAVMVKFSQDPTKTNSQQSGVDMPVFRYADVELLLAEAINNNSSSGPTQEAFDLINDVRRRAGLGNTSATDKASFQAAIENERLFELWAEGVRRDDLIRWGKYIQRAKDDGYNVDDHVILYPLPRSVVNQSKGIIAQNPGYN